MIYAIDSIWSIGFRYSTVVSLITRYRAANVGADRHDLTELLAAIEQAGGLGAWGSQVGTRHRTSLRGSIPNAEALVAAVTSLVALGIHSVENQRGAGDTVAIAAEQAWCAVRGQSSDISWRYLQLLLGTAGVKPDRMIRAFFKKAIPSMPDLATASGLVLAAAQEMDASPRTLNHRIWRYQKRPRLTPAAPQAKTAPVRRLPTPEVGPGTGSGTAARGVTGLTGLAEELTLELEWAAAVVALDDGWWVYGLVRGVRRQVLFACI